jgi:adenylosuccinate synthase
VTAEWLDKVKPVYKTVKGWATITNGVKNYSELPKEAKDYLKELEKVIGVKIKYISTGQSRYEIITV